MKLNHLGVRFLNEVEGLADVTSRLDDEELELFSD